MMYQRALLVLTPKHLVKNYAQIFYNHHPNNHLDCILAFRFCPALFGDVAGKLVSWYEQVVHVPERRKIISLRDGYMRNNLILKPHQVDYVFEVTESAESVNKFYQLYCINKDKNPYIFGANLRKFCTEIENSELLSNADA